GTGSAAQFRDARGLRGFVGGFWLVDDVCHTVLKVSGNTATTLAGVAGTYGDSDGTNATAQFAQPYAAIGLNGNVYAVDLNNANLRAIGATNTTTLAGRAPSSSLTFGSATAARYSTAMTMVADAGTLYAATTTETGTSHIFSVDLATGTSTAIFQYSGNNLNATGITKIGALLYVGLGNGTIHTLTTSGTNDTLYAGTPFMFGPSPNGTARLSAQLFASSLATDGTNLYYFDNAKLVREIDAATGTVNTVAGTAGSTTVVDGTAGAARFAFAGPLAFSNGTLYTVDGPVTGGMTVIRQITVPGGAVATLAGVAGMTGAADGVGATARFAAMLGIASDGERVFVTDPGGGYGYGDANGPTIRELILTSGAVSTMVGARGQWTTHDGVGAAALMNAPGSIVYSAMDKSLVYFDGGESVFQRIK
ncbi:MAG TPA: hypothetical protein VHB97_19815, partial [Polyangia bacterium]|nr:hypothetical protein [Polyangia bacterium]